MNLPAHSDRARPLRRPADEPSLRKPLCGMATRRPSRRPRLAAAVLLATVAVPAAATNYTITVPVDDAIDNGNCTLREALLAAATNAARDACSAGSDGAPDVIQLFGLVYAWTLGAVTITGDSVVVRGPLTPSPTALLDLGDHSRFLTASGATVVVEALSVRDGNAFPDLADPRGGFIRASETALTLRGSTFVSHRAFEGGVLSFTSSGPPLVIERCLFVSNDADSGGGMTLPRGGALHLSLDGSATARIVDSQLTANGARSTVAGDQAGGGALYGTFFGGSTLELRRVGLANNVAVPGSGGFSSGAAANLLWGGAANGTIDDTTWSGSDLQGAGVAGSALALGAGGTGTVRLDRARFTANDTGESVPQLSVEATGQSTVIASDLLVADGSRTGIRARAAQSSLVRIGHATVAGAADSGAALELQDAGVIRVESSLFWNNGEDVSDTTPSALDPSTMVGVDPLFVNAAGGDYTLGPGSPAVDFGNGLLPSVGPYDLAHASRWIGAQTDAGAFERRGVFADSFEVGDVGDWSAAAP